MLCSPCDVGCALLGDPLLDVAQRDDLTPFEAASGGGLRLAPEMTTGSYRKRLRGSADSSTAIGWS